MFPFFLGTSSPLAEQPASLLPSTLIFETHIVFLSFLQKVHEKNLPFKNIAFLCTSSTLNEFNTSTVFHFLWQLVDQEQSKITEIIFGS